MVKAFEVAGRRIGVDCPCFVIAEAGVNHNGDEARAFEMVDAAAAAGSDAVKFQTFSADSLVSEGTRKAEYQARTSGASESQYEMLRRLELPPEVFRDLMGYCRERNLLFMSTPFDEKSADLLDELGMEIFKVPSGEITNLPLLAHIAAKGKPMIVSTGMARLGEVEDAVRVIEGAGDPPVALLHCTSSYPTEPLDVNLRAMQTIGSAFGMPVGYSDHTLGNEIASAAVGLGACIIEKHFTLDRALEGPDHSASLEPDELAELIRGVRRVEQALGDGVKKPKDSEQDTAAVARKSIVVVNDISAGDRIAEGTLMLKRPGTGLPPKMIEFVVDRVARRDIPAGTTLSLDMLQ